MAVGHFAEDYLNGGSGGSGGGVLVLHNEISPVFGFCLDASMGEILEAMAKGMVVVYLEDGEPGVSGYNNSQRLVTRCTCVQGMYNVYLDNDTSSSYVAEYLFINPHGKVI